MAITAERLMQPMRFRVDVRNGLIQEAQYTALMKGDKNANRVIVEIVDGGDPVDLTGLLVEGSFIRPPDDARIKLKGTTRRSEAIIIIEEACYGESGGYQLDVELSIGETRRTVLSITGNVLAKGSGAILDISGVTPSVDDIIAQYAEMKRVTRETEEARDRAIEASMQANFTVLDRFATYDELIAKHPTGEAGQAFAIGTADDNVVYIWGIDTKTWVNIGAVQGAQGPTGATGAPGEDGKDGKDGENGISPSVTVEEIEGGHRVTITDANGTKTIDLMNGATGAPGKDGKDGKDSIGADQELNTTSDVKFHSVTTTQPLNADQLGGKEPSAYVLAENYETWTFTLDNGTTVTKRVIVVA